VNEGKIMKQFNGAGYMPGILIDFIERFIGQKTQNGPDPLASQLEKIPVWIIQTERFLRKMFRIEPFIELL